MIVAITGRAGAGKTTIARMLIEEGFIPVKFAGPLKAMMAAFYKYNGVTDAVLHHKLEGEGKHNPCGYLCKQTPRHAMQTLGTQWGRDCISPDLWTASWLKAVDRVLSQGSPVVTDDLRFLDEAVVVKELGGVIWRVRRPLIIDESGHRSETEMDQIAHDLLIENDDGLGALRSRVRKALDELMAAEEAPR